MEGGIGCPAVKRCHRSVVCCSLRRCAVLLTIRMSFNLIWWSLVKANSQERRAIKSCTFGRTVRCMYAFIHLRLRKALCPPSLSSANLRRMTRDILSHTFILFLPFTSSLFLFSFFSLSSLYCISCFNILIANYWYLYFFVFFFTFQLLPLSSRMLAAIKIMTISLHEWLPFRDTLQGTKNILSRCYTGYAWQLLSARGYKGQQQLSLSLFLRSITLEREREYTHLHPCHRRDFRRYISFEYVSLKKLHRESAPD